MVLTLTLIVLSIIFCIITRAKAKREVKSAVEEIETWAIINSEFVEFTPEEIVARLERTRR